jgi:hypothetical protein
MSIKSQFEVMREMDRVEEHGGNPGVDNVPQDLCPNEQTSPRNPVEPYVPDEGAFETFVDGAGI